MTSKPFPALDKTVPWEEAVTEYDKDHFVLYVWLLDAAAASQTEEDMCRVLFEREPCDHTRQIVHSHLKRARWMTQHGYRLLLK